MLKISSKMPKKPHGLESPLLQARLLGLRLLGLSRCRCPAAAAIECPEP